MVIEDMDYTMLRQFSRKSRLSAVLESDQDFSRTDRDKDSLASILLHGRSATTSTLGAPASVSAKSEKTPRTNLPDFDYTAVLEYLRARGEQHRHCCEPGLPFNALVLPPTGQSVAYLHQYGRRFSTRRSHEGNSLVAFRRAFGIQVRGFIETMWILNIDGAQRTFLLVQPLEPVPESLDPYARFQGFGCRVAYDDAMSSRIVLEPESLISHLVALRRPAGTFGIPRSIIVTRSLNQGRVPE